MQHYAPGRCPLENRHRVHSHRALSVDLALGIGGVPRGRVVEIFGPESSGKTTLMLHVIAMPKSPAGWRPLIDAEHALDPAYAKKLGVNLDELLVSQPDSGEKPSPFVKPWPVPMPWTSLLLTPSPPSCPRPNWKAKWAWPPWACRPA